MKFLFLDVDGVLNTDDVLGDSHMMGNKCNALCKDRIALLADIVQKTDCEVVISSDWRLKENDPALELLRAALFMWRIPIFGTTPDLSTPTRWPARWEEIEVWMNVHTEEDIDQFVIIDDRRDAGLPKFPDNFVRTDMINGLTRELADKAIEILNG